jgi:hypothetical protein
VTGNFMQVQMDKCLAVTVAILLKNNLKQFQGPKKFIVYKITF